MKVVVAGGTGLIGGKLVSALAADGHEAVVLSRGGRAEVAGVRVERWDAHTPSGSWVAELVDADAVVNLAGAGIGDRRWTRGRKRTITSSRIEATSALVDAIGTLPPGRRPAVLVNSSGIDYYGDGGDSHLDETSGPGSSFLAEVCVRWEQAAAGASEHGVRVVLLRTPLVLATRARALRLMALPFRLFLGGPLGSGRQWFPWIHVDDMVRVVRHAIDDETLVGPLNAVAPDLRRQREVAKEIGRVLSRPSLLPTPAPLLRLVLGEQADLLLHGQRATSIRLARFEFRHGQLGHALELTLR